MASIINRLSVREALLPFEAASISVTEMAQAGGALTQAQACALYKSG
jgi:hypothetical protein